MCAMATDDDLHLSIAITPLVDYFSCPICMCQLNNTCITKCGHRFCLDCLKECIDRHHKCPCCNKKLTVDDFTKDLQYDNLVQNVNDEKEKSEKHYFNHLIKTAANNSNSGAENAFESHDYQSLSPLTAVLQKHLKNTMSEFQRFHDELVTESKKKQTLLKHEFERKKLEVTSQSGQEALNVEFERKMAICLQEKQRVVQLIVQAYDNHLEHHIPQISILPVSVNIHLLEKQIQLPELKLKPRDRLDSILDSVSSIMEARGDPVLSYSDLRYFLTGPFFQYSPLELRDIIRSVVEIGATNPEVTELAADSLPVLEHRMKPGSSILIYGAVKCISDLPKMCFSQTFKKGEGQNVDYFRCNTCGHNWICRSCSETCHENHDISPYILNHQPTWACCYCPRKKLCSLIG